MRFEEQNNGIYDKYTLSKLSKNEILMKLNKLHNNSQELKRKNLELQNENEELKTSNSKLERAIELLKNRDD